MQKTLKILLITDEVWNDKMYPNNNMTNWFTDFDDIQIAHVYCSNGVPDNNCCFKYYQITDKMMLQSILGKRRAGIGFEKKQSEIGVYDSDAENNASFFNRLALKISKTHSSFFRLIRDFLWLFGRYDIEGLTKFINEFNPDLIFTQRVGSVKLCRLERIVKSIACCPMVALTGDNEYSLKMISFSPFFWVRRIMVHSALNKTIPYYSMYYTSSEEQANIYAKKFNIPTSLMFKCGAVNRSIIHKKVNSPIRIVYAGKLYCGRWKTLEMLGQALKKINSMGVKIIIEIYTRDKLTKRQYRTLNDGKNIFVNGAVTPDELPRIYNKSDIVLHVESMDFVNRLITQHSYSTKVIDCLSSGCAVMAVGWEKHSACIELKRADAALVATNKTDAFHMLENIGENPGIILRYAERAMQEIEQNHERKKIQRQMYTDFLKVIEKEGL